MNHRCEHKGGTLVRAFGQMGKGYLQRNNRCASKDTVRHIPNPAWNSPTDATGEAWFCAEHTHDQRRGVTKWRVAA